MSDEKMRVEFEAWVSSQGFGSTWQKKRNMYSDFTTHFAWEAWQASRAAMQGEPAEHCDQAPDWSQAPEGATHWGPETADHFAAWYREKDGEWEFWLYHNDCSWDYAGNVSDRILIPRPDTNVSALVEALERGFPLLSDEGLDEVEHHCEWVIQRERKRVHSILAAHRKQGGEVCSRGK